MIRNDNGVKRPSRVNTRDIRPIVAQVSTDWLKRKGDAKEVTFYFSEKDRSGEVREARARSR